MTGTLHPTDDALLLFAYGEAGGPQEIDLTPHLATCAPCRARLEKIERSRVAADWALERAPRRVVRWVTLAGLAAAAALALLLLRPNPPAVQPRLSLAVPRYMAPELGPIDSALTRLEQERLHAVP